MITLDKSSLNLTTIYLWKYHFWANVVPKFKIPRLIGICRIQWWWSLFLFLGKFDPKHQSSQNSKFAMSLEYLKKKLEIKLISTLWVSKFFTSSYIIIDRPDQALSKYYKVTSLQYPCSFSKKKLRMEFIFCMQINIKIFDGIGLACSKYPK